MSGIDAPRPEAGAELRDAVSKRDDVLRALADRPLSKPELVETLDSSRSTVDRAVAVLEAAHCIRRVGSEYHVLPTGSLALQTYAEFVARTAALDAAGPLVNGLPEPLPGGTTFLRSAEVVESESHAPDRVLRPIFDRIDEADAFRGFLLVVRQSLVTRLATAVRDDGLDVELVVGPRILDVLREDLADELRPLLRNEGFVLEATTADLPAELWLTERGDRRRAGITVSQNGAIDGVLLNDEPTAVEWASGLYEQRRSEARRVGPGDLE